jgi:release factor H-coupled RctB family protein
MNSETKAEVRVVATARTWIEGEAVAQLEATARLPGMRAAIGMPDLHPGKGSPIGAAFLSEGVVYPHLVGNDIGCGMGLWSTDLLRRKARRDRWADRLDDLDGPWDGDPAAALAEAGVAATDFDASLGTIGGGNHFAELQQVDRVEDADALARLGVDPDRLVLLVHSGSRGLGESVLRAHVDEFAAAGLKDGDEAAAGYLRRHDHATAWARVNRAVIARRFAEALGAERTPVLDVGHNRVDAATHAGCRCWLHRKGAAPATEGPVVIPGSRGSASYIVVPDAARTDAGWSLAHGAGRKWKRGDAKARLRERYRPEQLTQTALGGRVICEDRDLLYEEAPEAYKDIDSVVAALLEAGLCRVVATLRPLITYKTRRR